MPPDPRLDKLNAALTGHYRILREIGAGGMATVYLADDLKHPRHVAVKVLDPNLTATVGADRFLREIRFSAALQHPHILTLIDSGETDGILYYVMPYVDGITLRARLRDAGGPLPVAESIRILREMLDALSYAHAQGLVHRDVKPENVMISGEHVRVLDFGVAKAMQSARGEAARPAAAEGTLTSVGTSLGTPAYMAPEQAAGDPNVDLRADIYSTGLVAYELLAGRVPFEGRPHEVLSAQITAKPRDLAQLAPTAPSALVRAVMKCLEKRPEDRPQTAAELIAVLDSLTVRAPHEALWDTAQRRLGRRNARAAIAIGALAIVGIAGIAIERSTARRHVRTVVVPEMQRLSDLGRNDSALIVAEQARRSARGDEEFTAMMSRVAFYGSISTQPANARVSWSPVDDSSNTWRDLGTTPDSMDIPRRPVRLRFEAPGYVTHTMLNVALRLDYTVRLVPTGSSDSAMVPVRGGQIEAVMPGLSDVGRVRLSDFLMDRYEVTNREYRAFVEAGGYTDSKYWTLPISGRGQTYSPSAARALFVDRTGRPGPSTWEAGNYRAGADDLPVSGVSWYEAQAYAAFAGKRLPSVYHWSHASGPGTMSVIVPFGRYGADSPVPVGTTVMSQFGNFEMAGNVREWVANAFGNQRFILGGGWTDAAYTYVDAYAQDPLDRSAINGIRLIKLADNDSTARDAWAAIPRQFRDYTRERPVSDDVYRGLIGIYASDRTPLDVRVESVDSTHPDWVHERVSVSTSYGDERMPINVYVPKRGVAPMQSVVFFPGSNAFGETQFPRTLTGNLDAFVMSGRIVIWPVYASTYERAKTLDSDAPRATTKYRDHVVMWAQDLHRAVDYIVSRPDVDSTRIAYVGNSFGGRMAPIMLANEPRIRTAILTVAGLKMERPRPESDPLNFLPRVRIPLLMLNGEFDHYFPLETSQRPFLAMLGTPAAHKRHVVFPGGHTVPRTLFISESLQWLDRYLGEVER